jgi:hypothetical protein
MQLFTHALEDKKSKKSKTSKKSSPRKRADRVGEVVLER